MADKNKSNANPTPKDYGRWDATGIKVTKKPSQVAKKKVKKGK